LFEIIEFSLQSQSAFLNCDKIFIVVYFEHFIGLRFKISEIHVLLMSLLSY